jgi:hypothetical protein
MEKTTRYSRKDTNKVKRIKPEQVLRYNEKESTSKDVLQEFYKNKIYLKHDKGKPSK